MKKKRCFYIDKQRNSIFRLVCKIRRTSVSDLCSFELLEKFTYSSTYVWMQLLLSEMKSEFTVRNFSCLYLPVRWYWTWIVFGVVEQKTYPSNSLKSLLLDSNFSKGMLKYLSLMLIEGFGCCWLKECFKYDRESKGLLKLLIAFFFFSRPTC